MASVTTDRIEGLTTSVAIKAPVKMASTGNLTLSGLQTVDDIAGVADDRTLVKDNDITIQNGIYLQQTGPWTRASDSDGARDLVQGTTVAVQTGKINQDTIWRQTTVGTGTDGNIIFDTDSPAFELAENFVAKAGDLRYNFDSATAMANPGSGDVRFNNATFTSITSVAISANSAEIGSPDLSDFIVTWDDSTNSALRGTLTIKKLGAPDNFLILSITAALTDNTSWLQLTVAHVDSNGSFSNTDSLAINFSRTGDGADTKVAVSGNDTTPGTLEEKLLVTASLLLTTQNDGANETRTVNASIPSQAEAEAGTNNVKLMTPLRVAQAAAARGVSLKSVQVFDATGASTWTKPAGITFTVSEIWAGGGGGGGGANPTGGGGGGGSGSYGQGLIDVTGTASETVTIGTGGAAGAAAGNGSAGGASSFGAFISATGGGGGFTNGAPGPGGAFAVGGDVNLKGNGGVGGRAAGDIGGGGAGGGSPRGGGGAQGSGGVGVAGAQPGGGGSGGLNNNVAGVGGAGKCVVWEYS